MPTICCTDLQPTDGSHGFAKLPVTVVHPSGSIREVPGLELNKTLMNVVLRTSSVVQLIHACYTCTKSTIKEDFSVRHMLALNF